MIIRRPCNVRLSEIVGVSPLNPRHQIDDSDLDGLAASIVANGLIEDILVERCDLFDAPAFADGPGYYCLDGSRRWRALQRLASAGHIQPDAEIRVVEITASEAEMREIALAANFHRLNLHPVEQYEAFAGMARYRTDSEIAAHFRLEIKDVRKALALGRLAQEIRAAWKAGEIAAEAAQAYAVERDQSKQLEIFSALSGDNRNDPAQIRRLLRGDAVIASASIAIFARADYLKAGGAIEESLFEEQSFFKDGPLLRWIAERKLADIATRIRESQGWKWCATQFDGFVVNRADFLPVGKADYTPDDEARLDEIEAQELAGVDDATRDQLMREAEEIELRAWTRGVSAAERARLGIILQLDQDGNVEIEGGLQRPEDRMPAEDQSDDDEVETIRHKVATPVASTPATPAAKPGEGGKLKALKEAALARAIGDCAGRNVNVALAIVVASLASQGLTLCTLRGARPAARPNDLLDEIASLPFDQALARCLGAGAPDLTQAFALIVSGSISIAGFDADQLGRVVAAIGEISGIRRALDVALDRKAYFDAAPKEAALAAIRECLGETAMHDAAKLSRDKISDEAARVTADKAWLPAPWSDWTADLAEPDEGDDASAAPTMAQASAARARAQSELVSAFLKTRTQKADGQRVRATDMHAAFVEWGLMQGAPDLPALGQFGNILKGLRVQRYRHKTGIFYLGCTLIAAPAPAQIAAE